MCLIFVCPGGGRFPPQFGKPTLPLILIGLLLIVLLTLLMIIFIIYFVIALHALGNDIDLAKESHLQHNHREKHIFGVTNSKERDRHITTLIIWTLVTMVAAIFTSAGLIGAINLNGCLVISYVLVTIGLAISGFYLPYLTPTLWIMVLQIVSVVVAILFVLTLRCCGFKRHHKEVTFAKTHHRVNRV